MLLGHTVKLMSLTFSYSTAWISAAPKRALLLRRMELWPRCCSEGGGKAPVTRLQESHPRICTVPSIAVPHSVAYKHYNSLPNTYVCQPGQTATRRDPFQSSSEGCWTLTLDACWPVRAERLQHHTDSTGSSQGRIPYIPPWHERCCINVSHRVCCWQRI